MTKQTGFNSDMYIYSKLGQWLDEWPTLAHCTILKLLNFEIRDFRELACICHTLTIFAIKYIFGSGESVVN